MTALFETGLIQWLVENEPKAVDLLNRIDTLARNIRPKFDLQFMEGDSYQTSEALNNAAKGNLTSAGLDVSKVSPSALRLVVFAQLYEAGASSGNLAKFRWTRFAAIAESLATFRFAIERGYISAAYQHIRSCLELCGSVALLCGDIDKESTADQSLQGFAEWSIAVVCAANKRGGGTKLDFHHLAKNGLIKGKSKSYKPSEDLQDKTAVDLMKSIDLLDKRVKGVRHAYDFLCEYVHPNVGNTTTGIKSYKRSVLPNRFELVTRIYSSTSVGSIAIDGTLFLFIELLEILESVLVLLIEMDRGLELTQFKLSQVGKKIIRSGLRINPDVFEPTNPCPCFSGKIVSACCGRSIRLGNRNH